MENTNSCNFARYEVSELESKLLAIEPQDRSENILRLLVAYMQKSGLGFSSINYRDTSPYAILKGKTSVGYRKRINGSSEKNKIVLFCVNDGIDKDRIVTALGKSVGTNNDKVRPFRIVFEPEEFPQAVELLLENSMNI